MSLVQFSPHPLAPLRQAQAMLLPSLGEGYKPDRLPERSPEAALCHCNTAPHGLSMASGFYG